MTKDADVLIVGAGIFGLAITFRLLQDGYSVTLVDRKGPGSGASGGVLGALSPHMPEAWNPKKAFQRDALLSADAFWQEISAISDLPTGFARIGRLLPLVSERALDHARKRAETSREHWPDTVSWNVLESWDPSWLTPETARFGVVHESLSARIFPRAACAALAKAISVLGGEFLIGEVTGIESGQVLLSDVKTVRASTIVAAAGHPTFDLLGFPAGFGAAIKGQAALLGPIGTSGPLIFADGLYVLPHHDGRVAVGSTSEKSYATPTGTDHQLDDLIARARSICPTISEAPVVERWANLRPKIWKALAVAFLM